VDDLVALCFTASSRFISGNLFMVCQLWESDITCISHLFVSMQRIHNVVNKLRRTRLITVEKQNISAKCVQVHAILIRVIFLVGLFEGLHL
jgi:hypothetical protein